MSRKKIVILSAVGITTVCAMAGCASSTGAQVHWQDNNTPRFTHHSNDGFAYQFVYYPSEQIYFEPYSFTYYWFDHGQWHEANELPKNMNIDLEQSKVVRSKYEQPYMSHNTTVAQAGPGYNVHPQTMDDEGNVMYALIAPVNQSDDTFEEIDWFASFGDDMSE